MSVVAGADDYVAIRSPDTTPPTVTVPSGGVSANATTPPGVEVSFTATATDDQDGALTPTCEPASWTTFPIGATTVTCTATDATGNTGSASFEVTVRGAADQLVDLSAAVEGVGPGESLAHKVAAIQSAVTTGRTATACGGLTAFINQVRAQSGKKIPSAQASRLIGDDRRIQAVLGCSK
jgi:hypothetical protein